MTRGRGPVGPTMIGGRTVGGHGARRGSGTHSATNSSISYARWRNYQRSDRESVPMCSTRYSEAQGAKGATYFIAEFDKALSTRSTLGSRLSVGTQNEKYESEFEKSSNGIISMRGDEVTPNDLRSRDTRSQFGQLRSSCLRVFERCRFHSISRNLVRGRKRASLNFLSSRRN